MLFKQLALIHCCFGAVYELSVHTKQSRGVARGDKGNDGTSPLKPGKSAKDGEKPMPPPVVSLDSKRKLKFSLYFKNILLKFSKTFKIFLITFKIFNKL